MWWGSIQKTGIAIICPLNKSPPADLSCVIPKWIRQAPPRKPPPNRWLRNIWTTPKMFHVGYERWCCETIVLSSYFEILSQEGLIFARIKPHHLLMPKWYVEVKFSVTNFSNMMHRLSKRNPSFPTTAADADDQMGWRFNDEERRGGVMNQSAYPFLSYSLTRGFHVWSSSPSSSSSVINCNS